MDLAIFHGCEGELPERDMALLVTFSDGIQHWIPKSVIDDASDVKNPGDTGDLVIKLWFAEKEELEPDTTDHT